jgi:hypothetical protein
MPLHRGDRVELSEMKVDVVASSAGGEPSVCDFHFGAVLEARRYLWLSWDGKALRPFALPAVGQTTRVQVF